VTRSRLTPFRPGALCRSAMRGLPLLLGFLLALVLVLNARGAGRIRLRVLPPLYTDAKGAPLFRPEAVAFGAGGTLAVAEPERGAILIYKATPEGPMAVSDLAVAEAPYPIRLRVTSKGELLVLDGRSKKIVRVSAAGEAQGSIETGKSPGIRALAIDARDNLYVLDVAGPRILTFDPAGAPTGELQLPADAGFFSDVAVDGHGNLFLLDSVARQVYVLRAGSTEAVKLGGPLTEDLDFATSLTVIGSGHLFLLDEHGGGIVILGPDGSFQGRQSAMGWREGFLRSPSDIAFDGNLTLYVADRENNRVQVFSISQ
jgi:DNA-binding beta-propeller fold protein YncE